MRRDTAITNLEEDCHVASFSLPSNVPGQLPRRQQLCVSLQTFLARALSLHPLQQTSSLQRMVKYRHLLWIHEPALEIYGLEGGR